MEITLMLIGGAGGYLFAVSRDRISTMRSRKVEAIANLHDRVLEIERKELSNGRALTLAVGVEGGLKERKNLLSDWEVEYQSKLSKWRRELRDEENRARLWIDPRTVRLVGAYFMLMMQCKSWEEFGRGNLIEDSDFLDRLRLIFGGTKGILNKVVLTHTKTGAPRHVNCIALSDLCLNVIQRRVRLEVANPLAFRALSFWWRFLEWRNSA